MELKVLMMGGQRVGKSSALAAIMDSFINGAVHDIITAVDDTSLEKIDGVRQTSIKAKLQEIKSLLRENSGRTILVDSGKTNIKWDYKLSLKIPETRKTMDITFTDVNGEFFEGCNQHMDATMNMMKEYNVFIVAVDTPFMMEARNNGLVDSVVNEAYNCTDSIHTFLTQINDNGGKDAKLVIFAPVKCEKWAKENRLDEVSECLMEDYEITLKALNAYKKIQVEVMPIQTAGSIVFKEHKDAYNFKWKERFLLFFNRENTTKCALIDDSTVRLSNGTVKKKTEGELMDDMSAVLIPGTSIVRPNSWFEVTSDAYEPHNCEQLAFHILDFMCSKVIDAKIREQEDGILGGFFIKIWQSISGAFGGISLEEMKDIISRMNNGGLIKKSGEGIRILNSCNFRK